ncbi:unnamed protein product [Chironomus riparius]|uniref:ABC-type xenobiotic transporter n=1 Tax=Chironomus riparius TaxID=315576 RepID=A0A9N9RM28_9DIPT|nr:unnamed protein product [Chironomus riparius]
MILYGEFTTILVDRKIARGTSTKTNILSIFGGGKILTNASEIEIYDATMKDSAAFGIGCAVGSLMQLIFAAISINILNYVAQNQILKIRKLFLKSVLRQDMTWYDLNTSHNFAVRMTEDLDKLKEGIGEKLSIFIYLLMSFVISVIFSFIYGWKLTLVILSCAPIIIISTAIVARMQSTLTERELKAYSKAGTVAEEVLSSIRTVVAFGGENKELKRFEEKLKPAEMNGKKKGIYSGFGGGIMWLIIYCCYALAFWYGISLILEDRDKIDKDYTPAILIIVLFGVLCGAQNLGFTAPYIEAFSTAKGSASSIFEVIDRNPEIDSMDDDGIKPKTIAGNIKFENITFKYPARKDVQVLNDLNLDIEAGKTVALVGSSGCGKSTCLQLIQHLYNPQKGMIYIDGMKMTEINTRTLRSFIGVVGQEPVLFATTIAENIRYGNPSVSNEEIEKAARIANCHKFISKLPFGYMTQIGERGGQLSGGQRQRIAIARALVRNPKILLLDEATSALDPTSEKKVQDALEKASKGRTTVVVTHRLSTIQNADKIVFINKGKVVEQGSHQELLKMKGSYYELVNANNSNIINGETSKISNLKKHSRAAKRSESTNSKKFDDSETEDELETETPLEETDSSDVDRHKISFSYLMKLNLKEWPFILTGVVSSFVVGASFPIFAILFGEMYGILSDDDPEDIQKQANFYSILFLVLGVATGIGTFMQTFMFNYAGVRLTSRLRILTFKSMMCQEIGWFDLPKNGVGALCARLANDCSGVQGATGSRIGSIVQAGSVIIIGIGVSFYYNYKMTLVALVTIPVVLLGIVMEARFVQKNNEKEKSAIEEATNMAVEAISNIRTIASLGQEPHILNRYYKEVDNLHDFCQQKARFRGFVFGLGQTVPLMGYGLSLWYGGTLVAKNEMSYQNVIKVGEALIFGSWMIGQALSYMPNVNEAIISASRIKTLLERVPKVKNLSTLPKKSSTKSQNFISFKKVDFRYPTRPNISVLESLNLDIKKGQTVALVGSSGCGKSTCIQLLLRYYDADNGKVEVEDLDTTNYPLSKIRAKLGLVSQEPVLFDRTIAENIAYGDNERAIIMTDIIEAAKSANIHDFISKLPKGYETSLGTKGTQLSGGQKQRIAIARALVRNPEILLLDEATSALDTQSEKIVQAALEKASAGRTCITIAHRLTTIQNSDIIYVLEDGEVAEKGTHNELMKINQKYAKLYKMQQIKE